MVATCRSGQAKAHPEYLWHLWLVCTARRPRRPDVVTLFVDDVLLSSANGDLSKGHFHDLAVTSGFCFLYCLNVGVADWTPVSPAVCRWRSIMRWISTFTTVQTVMSYKDPP